MRKKVFVVMPAYNAVRTLKKVYHQIPKDIVDKILLIDDGSKDQTVALSEELDIETIVHEKNLLNFLTRVCLSYTISMEVE